jgi:hypothetical protein
MYQYICIMEKDIENKEWMTEAPYLAGLSKGNQFSVPEDYFETLSDRIQGMIALDSWKIEEHEIGFTVPENYFDELSTRIAVKVKVKSESKIHKLLYSNFFKYSAAACIVLMSGILLYINEPARVSEKTAYNEMVTDQMLFEIDEEMIIDHIQQNETKNPGDDVSHAELENYILNNFTQSDLISE